MIIVSLLKVMKCSSNECLSYLDTSQLAWDCLTDTSYKYIEVVECSIRVNKSCDLYLVDCSIRVFQYI